MGSDVVRIHLEFFHAELLSATVAEMMVNHSVHLRGTGQRDSPATRQGAVSSAKQKLQENRVLAPLPSGSGLPQPHLAGTAELSRGTELAFAPGSHGGPIIPSSRTERPIPVWDLDPSHLACILPQTCCSLPLPRSCGVSGVHSWKSSNPSGDKEGLILGA